ncbi:hypothetical protein GGX14DRAFT_607539 [Mycena pura]|uniref:DUF6535 domain-containing protein n=1 Tax=Mycena pura TaxID=153505 RepID=A0AAD6Y1C0_9AGAR|nr:hypothetical protein GGX14DRAFT_607539 [Mycena pura]
MSANIPDDNAIGGSGAPKNPDASNELWSLYIEGANERAKAKADLWNGNLSGFLLFAGLFAGVVSSFLIDSRTGLQPGASRSTVAINFLWYSSLTFTLISALAAVLAQTWIVKFSLVPTRGYNGAKERWIHDDKAKRWNLHGAVGYITVLIQLALFLFLAGLAVQAVVDRKTIGWTILSLVGATATLYLGITVLPWFSPATPFSTPFSNLSSDAIYVFEDTSNIFFNDVKPRAINEWKDARDAGWRIIDAGRSFRSTFQNLVRTPPDTHVRQGICWEILKNSSDNESIRAAVLELIEKAPGPLRRKRLLEFGLPAKLCNRLEDLAHLPAGGDRGADFKRMKYYLHLTKWMLDAGRKSRTRTAPLKVRSPGRPSAIVSAFLPLLAGDALLNLDALPSVYRPLAFAIRVRLLVDRPSGPDIHWQPTDWNALVDALYLPVESDDALNLEQDLAVTVFRAAIRGLGLGHPSDHLRDDCAGMLAVCIASAGFSIDNTVVSSTSGEDRKPQNLDAQNKTVLVERLELNTGASQSRKLIKSFFKHLGEWSSHRFNLLQRA